MNIHTNNHYLSRDQIKDALKECLSSNQFELSIIYKEHTGCGFTYGLLKHITPAYLGYNDEEYAIITVVPTRTLYNDKLAHFDESVVQYKTKYKTDTCPNYFAPLDMFLSAVRKEGDYEDLEYAIQNKKCILVLDEVDDIIKSQSYRGYIIEDFVDKKTECGIKKVVGVTATLPEKFMNSVQPQIDSKYKAPPNNKRVKVRINSVCNRQINESYFQGANLYLHFQTQIDELIKSNTGNGLYIVVPSFSYYQHALQVILQNNKKCLVINGHTISNRATKLSTELQSAITTNETETNIYLASPSGVRGIDIPYKKEWDIVVMCSNAMGKITFGKEELKQINGRPRALVNKVTGEVLEPTINSYYFFSKSAKLDKKVCAEEQKMKNLVKKNKYLKKKDKLTYKGYIHTVKDRDGFDYLQFSHIYFDYVNTLDFAFKNLYKKNDIKRKKCVEKKVAPLLPDNLFRSYKSDELSILPNHSSSYNEWFRHTNCKSLPLAFYVRKGLNFCSTEKENFFGDIYKVEGNSNLDRIIEGVASILLNKLFKAKKPEKIFNECKEQKEKREKYKNELKELLKPLRYAINPLEHKAKSVKLQENVKIAQIKLIEEVTEYLLTVLNLNKFNYVYYRDYNKLTFYGGDVQEAVCKVLNKNGFYAKIYDITAQAPTAMVDYVKKYDSEGYSQITFKKTIYRGDKASKCALYKKSKVETNTMINGGRVGLHVSAYMKACYKLFKKLQKDKTCTLYGRTCHELFTKKEQDDINKAKRLIKDVNKEDNPHIYFSRLHDSVMVVSANEFNMPNEAEILNATYDEYKQEVNNNNNKKQEVMVTNEQEVVINEKEVEVKDEVISNEKEVEAKDEVVSNEKEELIWWDDPNFVPYDPYALPSQKQVEIKQPKQVELTNKHKLNKNNMNTFKEKEAQLAIRERELAIKEKELALKEKELAIKEKELALKENENNKKQEVMNNKVADNQNDLSNKELEMEREMIRQKQMRVMYLLDNDPNYKWWEDPDFVQGDYKGKLYIPDNIGDLIKEKNKQLEYKTRQEYKQKPQKQEVKKENTLYKKGMVDKLFWWDIPNDLPKEELEEFKRIQTKVRYLIENDPDYIWWEDPDIMEYNGSPTN